MALSERQWQFVRDHGSATMITVGADGFAKVARIGVAVVGGKLWSSGTKDRVRTKRLRRDPRCTLFVFDTANPLWLAIETRVTILDGPDVAKQTLRLMRQMQGKPTGPLTWFGGALEEDAFLQAMVDEGRIIYEFAPGRAYGIHEPVA
jgi:hypothetical protein